MLTTISILAYTRCYTHIAGVQALPQMSSERNTSAKKAREVEGNIQTTSRGQQEWGGDEARGVGGGEGAAKKLSRCAGRLPDVPP